MHASTPTIQEREPETESKLPDIADDFDAVGVRGTIVVMEIDRRVYGVDVSQTISVVARSTITRIPGARREALGVINVRGKAVTVLDAAAMLGSPSAISTGPIVLLENGDGIVGFAVDAILDVCLDASLDDPESNHSSQSYPVTMLDACALCARFLISAEELRR